ncbi:MAG: YihY/virulence factor BrkB family protein [Chlamydiales bacterium]
MPVRNWSSFLHNHVWQVQISKMPKWKAFWFRFLRVILLTSQGFTKSQIQQGASSLTYYTLLAIVPVIALILGIARGFRLETQVEEWILGQFGQHQLIIRQIFKIGESSFEQVKGGWIATVGVLLFLWAGIKVLIYIERVMNQVWEVKGGRSFARRFSDYLAMLFLCPIIVLMASGLTVYVSTVITTLGKYGEIFETIDPILIWLFNLIPYILTCLLFTFLYIFIPNTRVRFVPAFWAGVITGTLFQGIQWVYLNFQIGVTRYNVIYGTFAIIPLFLIWLHLSWVILLLGAKIAFSIQNVDAYEFITEDVQLSHKFRTILSLRIAHYCIKKFIDVAAPPMIIEISNELAIPLSLTSTLIFQLVAAEVLSEVKRPIDQESGFQPAMDISQLTIKRVIDMINLKGEIIPLPPSRELSLILRSLEKFSDEIEKSDGNILLKDI